MGTRRFYRFFDGGLGIVNIIVAMGQIPMIRSISFTCLLTLIVLLSLEEKLAHNSDKERR